MTEMTIGVDWSTGKSETVVVIIEKHENGSVTIVGELRGKAAEHVARMNERLKNVALLLDQARERDRLILAILGRERA